MKVGYVRVSTAEQNTARQEKLMEELGVERVYIDKASGSTSDRPQLKAMMSFVREGDVVIVSEISRFARNTRDLLELIDELRGKGVEFESQKEKIDTSTATGKFMLTVFGAVAELEREYIRQRQREGINVAMLEGRVGGRPRIVVEGFEEEYKKWKAGKQTAVSAMKNLGLTAVTFYRRVKEYEELNNIEHTSNWRGR